MVEIKPTAIPDVIEFIPQVLGDERGYFFEGFRTSWLAGLGVKAEFVQQNQSFSQKGILRGLHYQLEQPQGKLVRVLAGEVYDVAVDIREDSATYGQWVGVVLNAELKNSLWVPIGFAHGFLVLSETAEVMYQCTDYYHPQSERSIHWQDTELAIDWPLAASDIRASGKDATGLPFTKAPKYAALKSEIRALEEV